MTALRPELPVGPVSFQRPPPAHPLAAPSTEAARRPSPAVRLREVPSRRFPGPAPAADDLVRPGDPVVGRLVVDSSCSALSPHLRGRRIAISVDGVRRGWAWGRTVIDLPPGRHLVQIEVEQAGHRGNASEMVPVAAGSVVEVFYRAPALPWTAGAIGPTPRRARGRASR